VNKVKTLLGVLALALTSPVLAAERMLELRLAEAVPIEVHNLVGSVRLAAGDDELVIRATVSADDQAIADTVRLTTRERRGVLEVVVEYPEDISRIRYAGEEIRRLDARIEYQDRKIRVTTAGGDLVRVDLEIAVPADSRLGVRQAVGTVEASGVQADLTLATRYGHINVADGVGKLVADTGSGRVKVASFRGAVLADTGSGGVNIENVLGDVTADTGSGTIELRGIDGEILADTGSGGVKITDARSRRVTVDTGSGGVSLEDVAGSLHVDTGSGSVRGEGVVLGPGLLVDTGSGSVKLEGDLGAVRDLVIDIGSGGVELHSSSPLSLRLALASGSGGIRVDVPVMSNVETSRNRFRGVVGAGEGSAKVSTGSGGIKIVAP